MSYLNTLGYSAASIILISMLLVKSQVTFHAINAVGYICLAIFALFSNITPVVYFCSAFVFIDLYKLYILLNFKPHFDILEVNLDEQVLQFYCKTNKTEIDTIFGKNAMEDADKAAFVFRNNDIAGIIAYSIPKTNTARIVVDFGSPKYRDYAAGRYMFITNTSFWKSQGIEHLEVYAPADSHIHYLEKMGFTQSEDPATWEKNL